MSDVFDAGEKTPQKPFQDPNQVGLDQIVGEGKKFSSVEDLVKSYAHAQNHITDLERTQEQLRGEVVDSTSIKEMLAKLEHKDVPNSGEPEISEEPEVLSSPQAEQVDIETKIAKAIEDSKAQDKAQVNADKVRNALVQTFGNEEAAKDAFLQKATSLGLSVNDLNALASKNPDAALKLLDVKAQASSPGKLPTYNKPTVASTPDPDNPKTLEDFNALRRKDPRKYFSPAVQKKLNQLVYET